MEWSGIKYDGMNLILYYHLPSILSISFLTYPNNGTKYLFHSTPSYFTPLYSAPLHSMTFHQSKRSLRGINNLSVIKEQEKKEFSN
jgi:hypothetical protein